MTKAFESIAQGLREAIELNEGKSTAASIHHLKKIDGDILSNFEASTIRTQKAQQVAQADTVVRLSPRHSAA